MANFYYNSLGDSITENLLTEIRTIVTDTKAILANAEFGAGDPAIQETNQHLERIALGLEMMLDEEIPAGSDGTLAH